MEDSTKTGLANLSKRIKIVIGKELLIEKSAKYFIVKLPILKQ